MDDDTIVEENTLTELFLAQKNICGMGKTFGFLSSMRIGRMALFVK